MEEDNESNDLNENCDNNLYKFKSENCKNDSKEIEKTYRSVISVNILNNVSNVTNNNFVQTANVATNTLKSDFLNSTLKSPNLVKNNIIGANTKNLESAINTDLNKNCSENLKNIDRSIGTTVAKTLDDNSSKSPTKSNLNTDPKKPLKGILKNSTSSPSRSIKFNVDSSPKKDDLSEKEITTVDEIQTRLAESQCKISQLQNSLPTKLNSATIESLKVNYSPLKSYQRTANTPFKTKLESGKSDSESDFKYTTVIVDSAPKNVNLSIESNISDQITDKTVCLNDKLPLIVVNGINSDTKDLDSSEINENGTSSLDNNENDVSLDGSQLGTSTDSLEDEFPDKLDAYALFIKELTMSEDKKKKRSSSFRKIFPAKLFGLQKDKKSEKDDQKVPSQKASLDTHGNSSTYFNRNTRERHTFSNFPPCKSYNLSSKERRSFEHNVCATTQDYHPSWSGNSNLSYFKEDEYSLPIDACITNDKIYCNKKDLKTRNPVVSGIINNHSAEDYVCMNSKATSTVVVTGKQNVTKNDDASYVNIDSDFKPENATYVYEKSDLNKGERTSEELKMRKKSNSISLGSNKSQFNKHYDMSQDRHVLIEPTKAAIPLNTERALPNPYHKNNNMIPESIILEPMYINVNNKKQERDGSFERQDWDNRPERDIDSGNFNRQQGIESENFNKQEKKIDSAKFVDSFIDKDVNKILNIPEVVPNLGSKNNSPYETIFGNVPIKSNLDNLDKNLPQHHGRIHTRSLSPEQRYKMDCVKTSPIKTRNMVDPIDSSTRSLSPEEKSSNKDCCLRTTTSPKKNRDSTTSKVDEKANQLFKSKVSKIEKKKNNKYGNNDEFSHQNLEIPIDYPEVNLNSDTSSKNSPKKQLYENFSDLDQNTKETNIPDSNHNPILKEVVVQNKSIPYVEPITQPKSIEITDIVARDLTAVSLTRSSSNGNCASNPVIKKEESNMPVSYDQREYSPKHVVNTLHQNSPTNIKNINQPTGVIKKNPINSERLSQQSPSRISPITTSHSSSSSPINYSRTVFRSGHVGDQEIVSRFPIRESDINRMIPNNNQRQSPSRISPAIVSHSSNSSPINYPRASIENCHRESSLSPQRYGNNSNSPLQYNPRMAQNFPVIQQQLSSGRGVSPTSPQKLRNLQNVEAFYWKKISEMKEKEQMNHMYFNPQSESQRNSPQMNQSLYNNVSDTRQSRSRNISASANPVVQNKGRRSLSLPRNVRPERPNDNYVNQVYSFEEPMCFYPNNPQFYQKNTSGYGYTMQQTPPTAINNQNQLPPVNPNFNRRTPQRSTISAINYNTKNKSPQTSDVIYENYVPGVEFRHQAQAVKKSDRTYAPIFKRGSLQPQSVIQEDTNTGGPKKVSFMNAAQQSTQINQQQLSPAWPTKNGYVQSPPTRRNNRSESVGSDNVFTSTPPGILQTCDGNQVFFANNQEFVSPIYGRTSQQEISVPIYGQPSCGQNPQEVSQIYGQTTIYGKTSQRQPDMSSTIYGATSQNNQNISPIYGKTTQNQSTPPAIYGKTSQPKQVMVRNKVCDIYGQIHDSTDDCNRNQIYGQIKKSGIIYGELKGHPNAKSPPISNLNMNANRLQQRALPSPPQQNASMMAAPTIPRSSTYAYNHNNPGTQMNQLSHPIPSESESGSEAGEIQRILQNSQHSQSQGISEEEWNADGKSGRGHSGNDSGGVNSDGELRGSRSGRSARREDPRRHTLSGDQHLYQPGGTPGGILRTMDLESSLPRGYPPPSAMLFDDDPGIMSEVETSSTGFRRGGKQRSSLPVVRTPSKTLERPLGLVFLQYRNETKRALLPNEITSIDTVKALFVRSFPKQLTMEYLDSPLVKIYIHDSSKDMFYELEDLRSHLRDIRDRSVLRLFESTDISGGLPVAGQGISGGVGHFEDQSYFSEPEFDSEYQHQHIHKSKSSAKAAPPYYLASTTNTLPRGGPLLRTYSPAVGGAPIPADRIKSLPGQTDRMRTDGYMSSPERSTRGQYEDPYYSQFAPRSGSITPVIDEEASDTELLDESYSLYGAKLPSGGPRAVPAPRSQFPTPAAVPYDTTRIRVEHMERQLANLTGLVQKALTQAPPTPRDFLIPPGRDSFRSGDEFDKNSSSSSTSLPDDSYLRSDTKTPKLGKSGCHKSVSFEKSVSFSDEPPDMNSPKQHSPQHTADTKPPKPAIKSSTLPRTSSQERDRLKPAPPPKPAALAAVQYDSSRHLYRDLQLTPEMYNQLRGLQKKAKDLRAEVRNLRRMSQAQAHSVRETIRDTFIKIRTMLLVGGEQAWQAGMDQERVRLSREEDLYKQEMIRLEKDLSDLESTVEELRGNVINRKTRVNMSDVENMALILSKSSKTVADLKVRFPSLQEGLKGMLSTEMEKVVREEKFLKEEPERLESALRRCKKLTGTLVTLKRLASVQEQRLPCPGNPTGDGRLSPSTDETPPVTPTSAQHGKPNPIIPTSRANVGPGSIGGDSIDSESSQRPENALDALLDELQTFSRPHNTAPITSSHAPIQQNTSTTHHAPPMAEIGRKGSMDSHALTVSTGSGTGSLRRLHSYPSGSDTDNSPPIQPAPRANIGVKPPLPERNAELLQALAGRRVPPPPPPRTSSRSPLASPTSPGIPPRNTPSTLQHIQNVQNMSAAQNNAANETQSQFESARENLGLGGTLRRNVPGRSSLKERSQTLPRNIGSNLQVHTHTDADLMMLTASNSSSCESVNSQEGAKKNNRQEQLEMRHQELLKKQKALQEQYARLQQLQRGNNALTVVPPTPDILLKKTGSESNILQKMGLNMMSTPQINTGSLTHLANNNGNNAIPISKENNTSSITNASTTSKVYETDIL